MNNDIGSRGVYLSSVGEDVAGVGEAVVDGDSTPSMSGGGTLPLKMRLICWRRRQRPGAQPGSSRAKGLPRNLICPLPV
jgi:hypothetical protein